MASIRLPAGLPAHVRALLDPSAYVPAPGRVDLIQTHISYVLLAGDDVYKVKKAVDLGFLDFSTPALRRQFCEEEVRLNRRLCPFLYRGVQPVTPGPRGYAIGGPGEPVDYAVHMRRLPSERMMDTLVERDCLSFDMLGRLVARLLRFYTGPESAPGEGEDAAVESFARHWLDNFDQVGPFVGRTLSRRRFTRLRAFALATLEAEAALLHGRAAEGRVRDGHGDLRCESVCFDWPSPGDICISDCVEFSPAYRVADVGLDAGFLAMDLEARGRADLADLFVGLFSAAAGDALLPVAMPAFKSYRALVRAKVNSLLAAQAEVPARERARARVLARRYFALAESYTRRRAGPALALFMGPTGSGKSVAGGAVAARLGAALLTSDAARKRLFGLSPTEHAPSEAAGKVYSAAVTRRVYGELAELAAALMAAGRAVVVDATFLARQQRAPLLEAARALGAPYLVVECSAPEDVVRARQEARAGQTWSASDATWETYLAQKRVLEEPAEVEEGRRIRLVTTAPLAAQIQGVVAALGRQAAGRGK